MEPMLRGLLVQAGSAIDKFLDAPKSFRGTTMADARQPGIANQNSCDQTQGKSAGQPLRYAYCPGHRMANESAHQNDPFNLQAFARKQRPNHLGAKGLTEQPNPINVMFSQ